MESRLRFCRDMVQKLAEEHLRQRQRQPSGNRGRQQPIIALAIILGKLVTCGITDKDKIESRKIERGEDRELYKRKVRSGRGEK